MLVCSWNALLVSRESTLSILVEVSKKSKPQNIEIAPPATVRALAYSKKWSSPTNSPSRHLLPLSSLHYPPLKRLMSIKTPNPIAIQAPVLNPPPLDFGLGEYEDAREGVDEYELRAGDFRGAADFL